MFYKPMLVIYFCLCLNSSETLSLTLREELRLRVFEKRVLRRIFTLKRRVVTGSLRKLDNKELHNLYSSPNIIRMMKSKRITWRRHVARTRKSSNKVLCRKARRKEAIRKNLT
jgi:hypothetical protein